MEFETNPAKSVTPSTLWRKGSTKSAFAGASYCGKGWYSMMRQHASAAYRKRVAVTTSQSYRQKREETCVSIPGMYKLSLHSSHKASIQSTSEK